jgi:hypothetical protein
MVNFSSIILLAAAAVLLFVYLFVYLFLLTVLGANYKFPYCVIFPQLSITSFSMHLFHVSHRHNKNFPKFSLIPSKFRGKFEIYLHYVHIFFSLALQPPFGPWPTSMKLSVSLRFSRS